MRRSELLRPSQKGEDGRCLAAEIETCLLRQRLAGDSGQFGDKKSDIRGHGDTTHMVSLPRQQDQDTSQLTIFDGRHALDVEIAVNANVERH